MGQINRWWEGNPAERYWFESKDVGNLGAELVAPNADDGGRVNWSYDLCRHAAVGDVVLHYWKPQRAVVGFSRIASGPMPHPHVWAPRGNSARRRNAQPRMRDGYRIELDDFEELSSPVSLGALRAIEPQLLACKRQLEASVAGALYLPIDFSTKRPLRPAQGYFFKLPASMFRLIVGSEPRLTRSFPDQLDSLEPMLEGAARKITVNAFERNPAARRKCIDHHGCRCAVCGLDFEKRYGEIGRGFIHVHHRVPISELARQLGGGYEVDPVNDLIPVCPNCHAMIHVGGVCREIDEVRNLLG